MYTHTDIHVYTRTLVHVITEYTHTDTYVDTRDCTHIITYISIKHLIQHERRFSYSDSYSYRLALVSRIDQITGLSAKKPYKRNNILQKIPIILSILLTVATPYRQLWLLLLLSKTRTHAQRWHRMRASNRVFWLSHELSLCDNKTNPEDWFADNSFVLCQHSVLTATHCNTLQHTATHCNTLQHTATHCNTLQHTATHPPPPGALQCVAVCSSAFMLSQDNTMMKGWMRLE